MHNIVMYLLFTAIELPCADYFYDTYDSYLWADDIQLYKLTEKNNL